MILTLIRELLEYDRRRNFSDKFADLSTMAFDKLLLLLLLEKNAGRRETLTNQVRPSRSMDEKKADVCRRSHSSRVG